MGLTKRFRRIAWLAVLASTGVMSSPGCAGRRTAKNLDASTPEKALVSYLDAIEAEDAARVRSLLHASGPNQSQLADDLSRLFTAVHRLHTATEARFPGRKFPFWDFTAQKQVDQMRQDARKVRAVVRGDRAQLPDDVTDMVRGYRFVRQQGQWKIDVDMFPGSGEYPRGGVVPGMLYLLSAYCPALDAVAEKMAAGKYTTMDEAEKEFEKLCVPIHERVARELHEK